MIAQTAIGVDFTKSSRILKESKGSVVEDAGRNGSLGSRPERDLRKEEVVKMLEIAKAKDSLHWRILCCIAYGGLRVGEVVGDQDERSHLPGLQIEDLHDEGIWVNGKRGYRDFQALPNWLISELRVQSGKRSTGRIFEFSYRGSYEVVQRYARLAGIQDWKMIHPHSFRHFAGFQWAKKTGRDPWKVRDMLRHRSITSTTRYVGRLDVAEKKQLAEASEFV